jgi:hypothetical protein
VHRQDGASVHVRQKLASGNFCSLSLCVLQDISAGHQRIGYCVLLPCSFVLHAFCTLGNVTEHYGDVIWGIHMYVYVCLVSCTACVTAQGTDIVTCIQKPIRDSKLHLTREQHSLRK